MIACIQEIMHFLALLGIQFHVSDAFLSKGLIEQVKMTMTNGHQIVSPLWEMITLSPPYTLHSSPFNTHLLEPTSL